MNLRVSLSLLTASVALRDCGNPSSNQAVITSLGFFPPNPVPDQDTELWVAYDLRSKITGGEAKYSYAYNGIPFSPTVEDLCSQTSCPKEIGSYNETSHSNFPSGLSGKIVSKIQWTNQDSEPLWCVELTFKI
jgi:hypothetical protein